MWCDGGGSHSPSREPSPSFSHGIEMSPSPTINEQLSESTNRVPSITPPKPPPPYSYADESEGMNSTVVKEQISPHFERSGIEGIARKYESSVIETAALRRQVHSLKQQLTTDYSDPLIITPVESPCQSPQRGIQPPPGTDIPTWNAMNIDVVTKLQALEQVDMLRTRYEDRQHELEQELIIKEEVLSMLTEQMKTMVDKNELTSAQSKLITSMEKLKETEKQNEILASEKSENEKNLRGAQYEKEVLELNIKTILQNQPETSTTETDEIQVLKETVTSLKDNGSVLQIQCQELQDHLKNTQRSLASAHLMVDKKTAEVQEASLFEAKLVEKEELVRELADSLQAQSLAHKQTLAEAQEREEKLRIISEQKEKGMLVMNSLQEKIDEREKKALEAAEKLQEKEEEVDTLKGQLSGFTDHLQSHLSRKDEEMQRSIETHIQQVKLFDIGKVESDAKVTMLQKMLDDRTEESREEHQRMTAEISHQSSVIDEFKKKKDMSQIEIEKLESILRDSSRNTHELIDRQLGSMRTEISENIKIISRLEAQLQDRDSLIATQQESMSQLQANSLDDQQLADTNIALHTQCESHQNDLQRLKTHVAEREIMYARANEDFQHLSLECQSTKAELSDLTEKYNQQTAISAVAENALQQYRSDLNTAEGFIERLKKDSTEKLNENNLQANMELHNTKESLSWISTRLEDVSKQLSERDETISSFKAACHEKDEDIAKLKHLLQKSSDALDSMQACTQAAEQEYKQNTIQSEASISHLRLECQQRSAQFDSLEKRFLQTNDEQILLRNTSAAHGEVLLCSEMSSLLAQEHISRTALSQEENLRFSLLDLSFLRLMDSSAAAFREQSFKDELVNLEEQLASQKDSATTATTTVSMQASAIQHRLECDIITLKENLESSKVAHQSAKTMLSNANSELVEKCRTMESLEMHLKLAKSENSQLAMHREDLQRQLSSELQNKEMELSDKDTQLDRYKSAQSEIKAATEAKEQLLRELSSRMDEKSVDVRHLHVALEETISQVRVLREELVSKETTHSQELLNIKNELATAKQHLREQGRIAEGKIDTLEQELSLCYAKLKEKDTTIAETTSKLLRVEDKLSTTKTSLIASKGEGEVRNLEVHGVQSENKRNQLQIDSLRKALSEKDDRLTDKDTECERLRLELKQAIERSLAAASQLQSTDLKRIHLENELTAAQSSLSCKTEDEEHSQLVIATRRIELLEDQLKATSASSESKSDVQKDHNIMLEVLKQDLVAKDAAIRQLQMQLNELQKSNVTPEHATMAEKALTELTSEVQRLRSNAQTKDQLMRSGGTSKSEVIQLRAALEDEVNRVQRLNNEIQDLHSTLQDSKGGGGAGLREIYKINDEFAGKYCEIEGRFCTPYITPASEQWDSNVVAAFVRSAKQWYVEYSNHLTAKAVGSSLIGMSPPKISPPRSRELLAIKPSALSSHDVNNKVAGATPGSRLKRTASSSSATLRTFPTTPTSQVHPSHINKNKKSPNTEDNSLKAKKSAAKPGQKPSSRLSKPQGPQGFRFR